jgi:Pheromone A receptor
MCAKSHAKLKTSHYFRLMALAVIQMLLIIPISIYDIAANAKTVYPFLGWAAIHEYFTEVTQIPASIWRSNRSLAAGTCIHPPRLRYHQPGITVSGLSTHCSTDYFRWLTSREHHCWTSTELCGSDGGSRYIRPPHSAEACLSTQFAKQYLDPRAAVWSKKKRYDSALNVFGNLVIASSAPADLYDIYSHYFLAVFHLFSCCVVVYG